MKAQCILVFFQGWFCCVFESFVLPHTLNLRQDSEPYMGVVVILKTPPASVYYTFIPVR